MTIHKTAYDTTVCSGFVIEKTKTAIAVARLHGELGYAENTIGVVLVQGGGSASDSVPSFQHPVLLAQTGSHDTSVSLAVDVRPYGKYDTMRGAFVSRNDIELRLATARGKLNYVWLTQQPTMLRDISPLGMQIFCSWISEAVAKRYVLEFAEQFKLHILAGIYYNSLFSNDVTIDESEKRRLAAAISRNLRVQQSDVAEVIDEMPVVNNMASFCEAAATIVDPVRLAELNPGVMIAILGGTWFNANSRELIGVALEHPPTWLAILVAAFNERTFKNSQITRIAERCDRDGGKQFTRALIRVMELAEHAK